MEGYRLYLQLRPFITEAGNALEFSLFIAISPFVIISPHTVYNCTVGRVENSKTFQNQMVQCFFIGLYDIETGDDFYFFQKFFFDGWKWILKKSIFTREKLLK